MRRRGVKLLSCNLYGVKGEDAECWGDEKGLRKRVSPSAWFILNIICCVMLYVVKQKQRVEGKRKERDEKRKEGFAHQWSFFGSVRTQVGRLLCEVIGMFYVASCGREEPLVSRVRTQLMCGEDTTVSSLPNYRLRISSQTPSVVPISPFFSILKILFTPFSFKIFGGRGAIEGQWQDPPVWRQEDEVGKNFQHRATHIIVKRKELSPKSNSHHHPKKLKKDKSCEKSSPPTTCRLKM